MARVQLRCTGSFRLDAGIRRLHRNHKFAEPLAKTVALSFHHSCRSELTRQGISLDIVTPSCGLLHEEGWTFLPSSTCRHVVRTISSPACAGDWRIVSEDSGSTSIRSFLRIVRTPHIFTAEVNRRVVEDSRIFPQIASFY
jgi:hypothetical protein